MADPSKKIVSKRVKIDKANATILSFIAVASFVVVFSLVSIRYLINQFSYQVRVQSAQHSSLVNLGKDKTAAVGLVSSYEKFNNDTTNILGGSSSQQNAQNGGDNAKVVLDALPSSYDYPALLTSITTLINQTGATIVSLSGTDTGASGSTTTGTTTATVPASSSPSAPIAMPFAFSVQGTYTLLPQVITKLEESIRPMQIESIGFSGTDQDLVMNVSAVSYYLPASGFNVSTESVK